MSAGNRELSHNDKVRYEVALLRNLRSVRQLLGKIAKARTTEHPVTGFRQMGLPIWVRQSAYRVLYRFPTIDQVNELLLAYRGRLTPEQAAEKVWEAFTSATGAEAKLKLMKTVEDLVYKERMFLTEILGRKPVGFTPHQSPFDKLPKYMKNAK